MGFRIIDRIKKSSVSDSAQMRRELLEQEARRFGAFKGGDRRKSEEEFLEKFEELHHKISPHTTKLMVERLRERLKEGETKGKQIQGNLEPSIIMDLL